MASTKSKAPGADPSSESLSPLPFEYVFPAIRGHQAGQPYFVSMCPLRLIPKIFLFDEEELVPELRAQRTLNKNRLPEIARYIVDNPGTYVFSAITASIDGQVRFEAFGADSHGGRVGVLHIPMSARFVINDGQHRRAAIEMALRDKPEIGDESIAVVFFLDAGLERCQQMFADLNRHAVRPAKSIGVLYDHRDERAAVARLVVIRSRLFHNVVETERVSLSAGSRKLFTLSAIFSATKALLDRVGPEDTEARTKLAQSFWEAVAEFIPEWQLVADRKMTAGDVRAAFMHSHGVTLHAIGRVGNAILKETLEPAKWRKRLRHLSDIDWSRSNAKLWEGRAMVGGRLSKTENAVILCGNLMKKAMGLPLTPEELRVEEALRRGDL